MIKMILAPIYQSLPIKKQVLGWAIFLFLALPVPSFAKAFELKKYEKNPKNFYAIGTIVNRYSRKNLMKLMNHFVFSTRPSRLPGTAGHSQAVSWLSSRLNGEFASSGQFFIEEFSPDINYGIHFYQNDFDKRIRPSLTKDHNEFKRWAKFTASMKKTLTSMKKVKGKNLIWEKKGSQQSSEILILGAHFDTIAYDKKSMEVTPFVNMPGANDNGTGVTSLIALIEILNKLPLPKTIRIVFFDFNEMAFLGSRAYIKKNKEALLKDVKGFVNVEMIGNDTKLSDKNKKLRNFKAYIQKVGTTGHVNDKLFAEKLLMAGKKSRSSMKFELDANSFDDSDHINFWKIGIPGVALTQNFETDYNHLRHHGPNDFPETLNTKSFYESFKFIAGAVIAWSFDITR